MPDTATKSAFRNLFFPFSVKKAPETMCPTFAHAMFLESHMGELKGFKRC